MARDFEIIIFTAGEQDVSNGFFCWLFESCDSSEKGLQRFESDCDMQLSGPLIEFFKYILVTAREAIQIFE